MTAFSVAVTLASSRNSFVPAGRPLELVAAARSSIRAPSASSAWMCVSRRRRPITSPPGGGTTRSAAACEQRPGEQDRRPDLAAELLVELVRRDLRPTCTRTSFGPVQSASPPICRSRASIVSTSLIRGTFSSSTGWSVSTQAARIGSAAFLFPVARTVPERRLPPSITKDCLRASATAVCKAQVAYPPHGTDPRAGLGDADGVHEERGAAAPRARRRGLHGLVRARLRRGRGALARGRRCSTTSTTRSTPRSTSTLRTARRSCASSAIPRWSSRRCSRTRSTSRCRGIRRSRRRCSRATSCPDSWPRAASSARTGSRRSSLAR